MAWTAARVTATPVLAGAVVGTGVSAFNAWALHYPQSGLHFLTLELWTETVSPYLLFGLIVTTSVRLAGVLLVFSFLIIPAVSAAFLAHRLAGRMLIAWVIGALGAAGGLAVSFQADWPTGATIVCAYGVILLCVIGYSALRRRTGRSPAH